MSKILDQQANSGDRVAATAYHFGNVEKNKRGTSMRLFLLAAATFAAVSNSVGTVQAQDFTIDGGATLTSRYVSNGLAQSDGPAFQPWIEVETSGFYMGLWGSNVSRGRIGHATELNITAGFRNEVGKLSYDLGYARYIYFGPRDNCCGEVFLNFDAELANGFSLGTGLSYDPSARVSNTSLSANLAVTDEFSFATKIGKISKGGQRYWSVGAAYALNDNLSASVGWHDTNISRGLAVLSVDYNFSIR